MKFHNTISTTLRLPVVLAQPAGHESLSPSASLQTVGEVA